METHKREKLMCCLNKSQTSKLVLALVFTQLSIQCNVFINLSGVIRVLKIETSKGHSLKVKLVIQNPIFHWFSGKKATIVKKDW